MKAKISEIAGIIGAPTPAGEDFTIRHLLTDSRSLTHPGDSLFFAFHTATDDGHRFIRRLYERGVRAFVVERIPEEMESCKDAVMLVVDNTLAALSAVGAYCRRNASQMLAITGSRGKTTLKEWLFQLLSPLTGISRSPRSYNSRIGVPLSLWEIEPGTPLAIIEAGISKVGEMVHLADIIRPDTVIITNVGDAHAEGFASMEIKAEEKALLASCDCTNTVIYCADSPLVSAAVKPYASQGKRLVGWSIKGNAAPLQASVDFATPGSDDGVIINYSFEGVDSRLEAPLKSETDVENAMNALAFMLLSGIDREVIASRFADLHKISTRLNVSEGVNSCSVIHDSYTSDFSSLSPALDFMRRRAMPGQSLTLILSDLLHETGSASSILPKVADLVRKAGVARFIGVGENMVKYSSLFPEGSLFFSSTEELLRRTSPSDFSHEIILLKGAPDFRFSLIAEMLEARTHETVLEVNLDSIVRNYNYFRRHLPAQTGIVCMVKASGYGAGSYEIAKTLQDCGAAYLAVAVLDEGIELRRKGISMPIMVMNPKVVNYRQMFANRLEPEIYSLEMLADVIKEAEKNGVTEYPLHIKLDTGMHRMGFIESELPKVVEMVSGHPAVKVKSVFSHLATADCPDMNDYTEKQLSLFRRLTDRLHSDLGYPFMRHILNSAGILRYPEHHYEMARLGIGLYGANTLPPEMEAPLANVSTLRTVIIAIREWDKGESIGYGRRTILQRKSRVATIPIGYADGMNRHFGRGNISVKVNGKDAPTLGNICMDACMIDVTDIDCKVGDSVEIFGANASVQRLADLLDTIPYEILTSVSPRVKRVYYRE